jgi:hypothetical protein
LAGGGKRRISDRLIRRGEEQAAMIESTKTWKLKHWIAVGIALAVLVAIGLVVLVKPAV